MSKTSIVLFLKSPRPGFVKTRLSRQTGPEIAAHLYRQMVYQTIQVVDQSGVHMSCYIAPEGAVRSATRLVYEKGAQRQKGRDLGERMKNAFLRQFRRGCERVLLIGSDCP
ncbi:MAG: DUF2064 domain-containing protein, partial [Chloroflexi bacterium]|nr:DUF2064 domain-containing protein [Chloroflexota bacterium]